MMLTVCMVLACQVVFLVSVCYLICHHTIFLLCHIHTYGLTYRNGQESASAAGAGHCLAAAYLAIGGSDAETVAEGYLNDCLAIYQRLHGPQSKKSVEIQKELCRLMLRMSRHKVCSRLIYWM